MDRSAALLIAHILLSGPWTVASATERLTSALGATGSQWLWPRRLIRYLLPNSVEWRRPHHLRLSHQLQHDVTIKNMVRRSRVTLAQWATNFDTSIIGPLPMNPAYSARDWDIPSITTTGQLADLLDLSVPHLLWLADRRQTEHVQSKEKLRNYFYSRRNKGDGSSRLIEAPKYDLKRIQRWICNEILSAIPVHEAAHGFVSGRSVVTNAAVHQNRDIVLRLDLRDFFQSIHGNRVAGLFLAAGYPSPVASLLTGLCTNTTWCGALEPNNDSPDTLFQPHLPQGSPASPALANLCAWSLDRRLNGLAMRFRASYSRYADDLTFSGSVDFERRLSRFRILALAILHNEGFDIRRRKTQVMRKHAQQKVTGVIVNNGINCDRKEFDLLRATLTNAVRHGLASQNRDDHPNFAAHLRGKIAWISRLNPKRGRKLKRLWDQLPAE